MTNEEIIQRYHQEKDEGRVFFNRKAFSKGFAVMAIIAGFLMIMSFLLTKETTITDIVEMIFLPFLLAAYGMKAYYFQNKTYYFITCAWFFTFLLKMMSFINMYF